MLYDVGMMKNCPIFAFLTTFSKTANANSTPETCNHLVALLRSILHKSLIGLQNTPHPPFKWRQCATQWLHVENDLFAVNFRSLSVNNL